jgi:metal-dependent amidase/aminoacylase/carboxypeptidase family protein
MAEMTVEVDFADILAELEADKELQEMLREQAKEIDRTSRSILTILNKIHSTPSSGGEDLGEIPLHCNID